MRCLIATLTILLTVSAAEAERVKFCFLFCAVESDRVAVDGFCTNYERVIRSPVDSDEVKKLTRAPKSRIARNDALYRCICQGWADPICKGL